MRQKHAFKWTNVTRQNLQLTQIKNLTNQLPKKKNCCAIPASNWSSPVHRARAKSDIAYAVNLVSRFNNDHSTAHWTTVKRIMRYLRATLNKKLSSVTKQIQPWMVFPILTMLMIWSIANWHLATSSKWQTQITWNSRKQASSVCRRQKQSTSHSQAPSKTAACRTRISSVIDNHLRRQHEHG